MNELKIIIENFNPVICVNGKIYKSLNFYIENAGYNNMLHGYYHNKEKNIINISYISNYAMKKIMGEV